jgi:hypothetical protein
MCWINDVRSTCPTCNNTEKTGDKQEQCPQAVQTGGDCNMGLKKRKKFVTGEQCTKRETIETINGGKGRRQGR